MTLIWKCISILLWCENIFILDFYVCIRYFLYQILFCTPVYIHQSQYGWYIMIYIDKRTRRSPYVWTQQMKLIVLSTCPHTIIHGCDQIWHLCNHSTFSVLISTPTSNSGLSVSQGIDVWLRHTEPTQIQVASLLWYSSQECVPSALGWLGPPYSKCCRNLCNLITYPHLNLTWTILPKYMMTLSNGNIFRVTGHLCGEFTGPSELPAQRPVTRSFDVFFDLRPNKLLSKELWDWWFETPSCPLWRQCNGLWDPGMLCNIGYTSETQISLNLVGVHDICFDCSVVLKFAQSKICTVQKFRNDYKQDFTIFGFKMSFEPSFLLFGSIRGKQRVLSILRFRSTSPITVIFLYEYIYTKKDGIYIETRPRSQKLYTHSDSPDSKFHVANMGPTWFLSIPGGPHVGPINLAIRGLGWGWVGTVPQHQGHNIAHIREWWMNGIHSYVNYRRTKGTHTNEFKYVYIYIYV